MSVTWSVTRCSRCMTDYKRSIFLVTDEGEKTCELRNLADTPDSRGTGTVKPCWNSFLTIALENSVRYLWELTKVR